MHLHLSAHQQRLADLFRADHDHQTEKREQESGRMMAAQPERGHRRNPDQAGADAGHERNQRGEHAEKTGMRNARRPVARARRQSLENGGGEDAGNGGARHLAQFGGQFLRLRGRKRRDPPRPLDHARAVEQEEIERDQHDHG